MSKHLEIEAQFDNINYAQLIKKIKEHDGILTNKKRLMSLRTYVHPLNKDNTYIRIRDEGDKITMTYKERKDKKQKYPVEREVIIDNMEEGDAILRSLGCKKLYDIEKIRETWKIGNCKEVVFDEYPGLLPYMEIECNTETQLKKVAKMLGYSLEDASKVNIGKKYEHLYGIPDDRKKGSLTFKDASKILGKYITKNKKNFNTILKNQQKFLNIK